MDKTKFSKLQEDVAVICDYLGDEKKHYEESGRPRNHIWCYVKKIRAAFKNKQ